MVRKTAVKGWELRLPCAGKAHRTQLAAAAAFSEHEVEVPAAALALCGRAAVKGVNLEGVQPEGLSIIVAEKQGAVQQHQAAVIVRQRCKGAPLVLHRR